MKTEQDVIDFALTFPDSYIDYPFDDDTPVMRRRSNNRIFALLFVDREDLWLNLKCDPQRADFLRDVYPSVIPGYHMNKVHWNTVILDGSVPRDEIEEMVRHSFELTSPPKRKR